MKRSNCKSRDINLFEEPWMQAAIKRHELMNFEISYDNRVADVRRGPGGGAGRREDP